MEESPKPMPSTSNDPPAAEAPQAPPEPREQAEAPPDAEVRSEAPPESQGQSDARPDAEAQPDAADPISVDELLRTGAEEIEPDVPAVDLQRAASILESLLLVSSEPLSIDKARQLLGDLSRSQVQEIRFILQAKYPPETSGILVEEVAKGLQFRTNPANQEHIRKLFDVKPPRFSRAALETVAIIAYKQPLTRQEIEQIRGVDCAGSLKTLMERRLVRVVGKKDVPGKPFLFGTTREFMEVFSLGSLSELPSMREIEEYLASSVSTPVEVGRPGIDLPDFTGEPTESGVMETGPAEPPPDDDAGEAAPNEGRDPVDAD